MVVYGEHIEKDPTEGLYWQITAFFKSALCENVRLVVGTIFVMILVVFDFAGLALGYQALDVHPAAGFIILVSGSATPSPCDLTRTNLLISSFFIFLV